MPEKRYKKGCGPSCIKCWVNNLKHGNKEAKAYLRKHPELLTNSAIIHDYQMPQESKGAQTLTRSYIKRREEVRDDRIKYARKNRVGKQSDSFISVCREEEKELDKKLDGKEELAIVRL